MLFLIPNLYIGVGLPLTAPLATVVLLWALAVKFLRDADDDPRAFRRSACCWWSPRRSTSSRRSTAWRRPTRPTWAACRAALTSTTNLDLARPILWISLGLFAATGFALFVRFLVNLGRSEASTDEQAEETRIAA